VIVVDTNVGSEPLKVRGDPRVVDWLDRQPAETLFISTISVSEILFGVAALPPAKRRTRLAEAFENEIVRLFAGRVLPFDLQAALAYAWLMSSARARGLPISIADGQIAENRCGERIFGRDARRGAVPRGRIEPCQSLGGVKRASLPTVASPAEAVVRRGALCQAEGFGGGLGVG